jgi:hypothetical protein
MFLVTLGILPTSAIPVLSTHATTKIS